MNADRQLVWVDVAKGLAVILMVYGHVARGLFSAGLQVESQALSLVDSIIYSFHMPIFFFLSGMFFVSGVGRYGMRGFALKRIDLLLYPYVVWSLLQGGMELVFSGYKNHGADWVSVLSFPWLPRNQLWFLYALLSISLFALLLYKLPSWGRLGVSILMYGLAHVIELPLVVAYIAGFSVYFFLGSFLADRIEWLLESHRRGLFLIFTAILFQYVFHGLLSLNYRDGGILLLPVAVFSLLAVLYVSRLMARGHPALGVAFLGRQSMAIFLGHVIVLAGVRVILFKVLSITSFEIHLLAGIFIAVLLPLLMVCGPLRPLFSVLFSPPARFSLFNAGTGRLSNVRV